MTMTDNDKEIAELKVIVGVQDQRIKFLERTVYWFIGFVALNLLGLFFLWLSTIGK